MPGSTSSGMGCRGVIVLAPIAAVWVMTETVKYDSLKTVFVVALMWSLVQTVVLMPPV